MADEPDTCHSSASQQVEREHTDRHPGAAVGPFACLEVSCPTSDPRSYVNLLRTLIPTSVRAEWAVSGRLGSETEVNALERTQRTNRKQVQQFVMSGAHGGRREGRARVGIDFHGLGLRQTGPHGRARVIHVSWCRATAAKPQVRPHPDLRRPEPAKPCTGVRFPSPPPTKTQVRTLQRPARHPSAQHQPNAWANQSRRQSRRRARFSTASPSRWCRP
jgi:hypothetical protein